MKTTSFLPPISLNNARRSVNAGIALHKSTMAKLLPPTTFPSLTSDHTKSSQSLGVDKSCNKVTKKKYDNSRSVPVTSPPTSASGQRKRGGGSAKNKQSASKQCSSTKNSTPTTVPLSSSSKNSSSQPSLSSTNKNSTPPISLSSINQDPPPPTSVSNFKNTGPSGSFTREKSNTPPKRKTSTTHEVVSSEKNILSNNVSSDKSVDNNASNRKLSSDKNKTPPKTISIETGATAPASPKKEDSSHVLKTRLQNSNSLKLKDEEPKTPMPLELKSGNKFYLPKRKLVQKPLEPFTLFITEKHALARLVWLYLLESQMPFKKISITSKEAERATRAVPSFCKHCIFTDGDSTLGQPTAIIRHICNHYSNNLLMGADTGEVSQAFSWLHWAVSVLHRDLVYLGGSKLKRGSNENALNDLQKSSLDSASLYFDMLDKIFSTRSFLLGSVAWFCDSAVALVLEDANPESLAQWPSLQEWLQRVKDQPNWTVVTNV